MIRHFLFPAAIALAATAAQADEVSDALQSALQAYQDGDVQYALEELEYAKQLMSAMKTEELAGLLPEAPPGWSREISSEASAGLAMMGGGIGAEAKYSKSGERNVTVTVMADNPMVGAMAGMLGNAAAMGAKIERIGRQKAMVKEGEITLLVDNRILIQAKGGEVEMMLALLKTMDFRALSNFGR